ncbi:glycosyl transferase [Nocardia mangyaensis]|uniref:Glycosyl transferase n=1 Tax=Nocardia mangyaensis TaxID=2213200 RepID=A0A1J0VXP3_9NOCA|nr:glycosyltransferase family 25 protein [Nocardia mangyaensis]APE36856.1 glycosyl transferase [Nocardia mangyaensis]
MIDSDLVSTYVVNLPRRADRRAWIERRLPVGAPAVFTSDLGVPIDGRELARADIADLDITLFDWQIESENPWWSRPLKFGEIGCTLAHLACWRHAIENSISPYVLVLEDDAILVPDVSSRLREGLSRLSAVGEVFDLLYLGRYLLDPDTPTPVRGIVRPGYSHCSFAYLFSREGVRAALSTGLERAIIPIDEFLPALYMPHPRADLRRRFPPRLAALAFDPPLATQRAKADAGSDTEESAFVVS